MILVGDALEQLKEIPDESVQCVVTSPPYWGLRDYGTATWQGGDPDCDHSPRANHTGSKSYGTGALRDKPSLVCKCGARRIDAQFGLEESPQEYVAKLVAVFREVRRVLRDNGTVFLNLGDSYANTNRGHNSNGFGNLTGANLKNKEIFSANRTVLIPFGLKPKDLVGIPWRVAFALQDDGWWLRSDCIWKKPNCMTESVTDRPTRSHEYVFLLTKKPRYFWDGFAVREPDKGQDHPRSVLNGQPSLEPSGGLMAEHKGLRTTEGRAGLGRNIRTVWSINQPLWRLRSDLSAEQKAYVLSELARRGIL